MEQQAKFEGWAVVELFGHAKEAGYVTTQYFGDKAMFQIDVPGFPDREITLERPEWMEVNDRDTQLVPKGSKVMRQGTPARSRIISPGAVYAMNPSSEEFVRKILDRDVPRKYVVLELETTHQIAATAANEDWKQNHEPGCDALEPDGSEDLCTCGAVEYEELGGRSTQEDNECPGTASADAVSS
jgi:hypothetical protein